MEKDLIGYLLGALEPDAQHEVELYLETEPRARQQLELLRTALAPLNTDQEGFDLPPDLAIRTIARVAQYVVETEGRVEHPEPSPISDFLSQVTGRSGQPTMPTLELELPECPVPSDPAEWRSTSRRNLLAWIGLSAAMLAIVIPAVLGMRSFQQLKDCERNLSEFARGLHAYADVHEEQFPRVKEENHAGTFIVVMQKAGVYSDTMSPTCPGRGRPASWHRIEGNDWAIPHFIDYAYTLGYQSDGYLRGLTRKQDHQSFQPLLSDAPTRRDEKAIPQNHRLHQVLFADGHVQRCTHANVGFGGDNIYYNVDRKVAAGKHLLDAVLGRPDEEP